jgi:hypothetical protein
MKDKKNSMAKNPMAGGLVMLFGLVVMLTVPMAIGHYTLTPIAPPSLHADAKL